MYIICHYAEIGLKGKNRCFFENRLLKNIKTRLKKKESSGFEDVFKLPGRIVVKLKDKNKAETNLFKFPPKIKKMLQNTFGISNFSLARRIDLTNDVKSDIRKIKKIAWESIKNRPFRTFRITAIRSNKNYKLTSQKINEQIGDYIRKKSKKKVQLKHPSLNCFIEIVNKKAFIYFKKITGPGGLPVGVSSRALVLLSGGFDSPIAAYLAMKRGIRVDYVHFHSLPYTTRASLDKVEKLQQVLNNFQPNSKIFMIPFAEIQKQIILNVPESLRVIFYRRFMLKIAENIAKKENYQALITGDSVGQVASQTLENMQAISDAVSILTLRPLASFDKEEIIKLSKKIDTYKISAAPHEDCCTRFMPRHPETKAKLEVVKKIEKSLRITNMYEITKYEQP